MDLKEENKKITDSKKKSCNQNSMSECVSERYSCKNAESVRYTQSADFYMSECSVDRYTFEEIDE